MLGIVVFHPRIFLLHLLYDSHHFLYYCSTLGLLFHSRYPTSKLIILCRRISSSWIIPLVSIFFSPFLKFVFTRFSLFLSHFSTQLNSVQSNSHFHVFSFFSQLVNSILSVHVNCCHDAFDSIVVILLFSVFYFLSFLIS